MRLDMHFSLLELIFWRIDTIAVDEEDFFLMFMCIRYQIFREITSFDEFTIFFCDPFFATEHLPSCR